MLQKITYGYKLYKTLHDQGKVPIKANTLLILIVIYVLLPFDFLPDIFPLIGQIDDLAATVGGLYWVYTWLDKKSTPADRARAKAVDV